jgi:hypothetical protein
MQIKKIVDNGTGTRKKTGNAKRGWGRTGTTVLEADKKQTAQVGDDVGKFEEKICRKNDERERGGREGIGLL